MLNDASLLSKPWKSFTFTFFPDKCNGELGNGGWEQNIFLQLKTSWTNQHQESEKYRKRRKSKMMCSKWQTRRQDKSWWIWMSCFRTLLLCGSWTFPPRWRWWRMQARPASPPWAATSLRQTWPPPPLTRTPSRCLWARCPGPWKRWFFYSSLKFCLWPSTTLLGRVKDVSL